MKNFSRAYDMLGRNVKETWAYLLTLTLSTSLLFVFVNLQSDINFMRQLSRLSDAGLVASNVLAISSIIMVIALICAANCFVANAYFVKAKSQELCVYLTCGMNIVVLAKFLIYQNLILLSVALLGGALFGSLGNILVNVMMNALLGLQGNLFTMSMNGVGLWGIILLIEMIYLILINVGYAYKAELKDLLDENRTPRVYDERLLKMPPVLYAILALIGLALIIFMPTSMGFMSVAIMICFVGLQGVYRFMIPQYLQRAMRKREKLQAQTLVVRGNVLAVMKTSYLFVIMMFATILFVVCFFPIANTLTYTGFILCIAYFLIMIVMNLSLLLKVILEAKKRKPHFHHVALLGLSKVSIQQCIKKEMKSLFGWMILLPLPFVMALAFRYVQAAILSSMVAIFLLMSYAGLLGITALICVRFYSKIVLDNGGNEDE